MLNVFIFISYVFVYIYARDKKTVLRLQLLPEYLEYFDKCGLALYEYLRQHVNLTTVITHTNPVAPVLPAPEFVVAPYPDFSQLD